MNNMKKISSIVLQILKAVPEARNSDDLLYIQVCSKINQDALTMPFCQVMAHRKELGLPVFESVRRSRQKVQAAHPELSACDEVEGFRAMEEQKYRAYARAVNV